MAGLDKRLHFHCGKCATDFSTGDVFPMDVKKLSKLVRETKCPTCGAGSKKLYLQANVKEIAMSDLQKYTDEDLLQELVRRRM